MKKYIATALALLCLLCFSACSPYPNSDRDAENSESADGTEAKSEENGGDEHVENGGIYTDVGNGEYGLGFDF